MGVVRKLFQTHLKSRTCCGLMSESVTRRRASRCNTQPYARRTYTALGPVQSDVVLLISGRATLAACACVLDSALPRVHVTAFALFRTVGFYAPFEKMIDPVVDKITFVGISCRRLP